jgi:hypothetical protein
MRKIAMASPGSLPSSRQALITPRATMSTRVLETMFIITAIFRIPGAWEEEGYKILDRYGVEYCDRTVSMWEAAGRAVKKVQAGG